MREIAVRTAVGARHRPRLDLAPTLAVHATTRWFRTYEGYSEHPEVVASYAGPLIEGLQGTVGSEQFLGPRQVVATAKHFLADGGTAEGRDQGDAGIDEAELRDIHAAGYPPALDAGVQAVMASSELERVRCMATGASQRRAQQRMASTASVVGAERVRPDPRCATSLSQHSIRGDMMLPRTWRAIREPLRPLQVRNIRWRG